MAHIDVPEDLFARIRDGQCVVFVGAGLSQGAGLPSWKGLIEGLAKAYFSAASITPEDKTDILEMIHSGRLIEVAQLLKTFMAPRAIADALERMLDQGNTIPTESHELLARIPFSGAITTNYDYLLEHTYSKIRGPQFGQSYSYTNPALGDLLIKKKFFIIKAHGTLGEPSNLIFSRSDYQEALFNQAYRTFFTSLFTSRTLLFIGYSLSDPDFSLVLEELVNLFRGLGVRHYALLSDLSRLECNLLDRRFNLHIIPYIPSSKDHPEIKAFLGNILTRIEEEKAEQKRTEDMIRTSERLQSIGTLAGGIAHDFNNILAGIMGYSELVLEELRDDSTVRRHVEAISKAGSRGKELVRQLLSFSSGSRKEQTPFSAKLVVEETIKMLRTSLAAEIKTTVQMDAKRDALVGVPAEFQQVVLNLAVNAAQAMKQKGGTLGITLRNVTRGANPKDRGGGSAELLELTVSDTGIGMDDETKKRMFDPFFSTKLPAEGSGMGLAVVYGIVNRYGGEVSVDSSLGRGTTFKVIVPTSHKEVVDFLPKERTIPAGKNERILYVDDEPILLDIVKTMLLSLGYRISIFEDPKEAVKAFESDPRAFDLVITDFVMPELNGKDLTAKILKRRSDVPIILVSGFNEAKVSEVEGIDAFLMKPISKAELAVTIRAVLDRKMTTKTCSVY